MNANQTSMARARIQVETLLAEIGAKLPPPSPTKRQPVGAPERTDGRIEEGGRNTALTRMAGTLRRLGGTYETIKPQLHTMNQAMFKEPLPDAEVDAVAHSICRYPQGTPGADDLRLHDAGNAQRLVENFGHLIRYGVDWKKWLVWTGTHWAVDDQKRLIEFAKKTAGLIYAEANAIADLDLRKKISQHAQASHQERRIKAMVDLAQSDPSVVVRSSDLDRDDWLLGVENGVINLRSGKLREHRPSDLMTRIAPVVFDPKAKCPTWWRFLNRAMRARHNGQHRWSVDRDLAEFLRRMVGSCLTGITNDQVLFFLYGHGANGKSTFLNTVRELLGQDYAKQASYETLTQKKFGRQSTNDLARLQGARAVLSSEIEDGSQLDESLVKQMTGGEAITARFLYAENVEFIPKFKLLIAGNHKPVIRGDDDGIWRRMQLIPFTETIPEGERDSELPEKLRKELPGILNWALRGCRDWRRMKLRPPKAVRQAVDQYRSDSDLLGQWIDECCAVAPGATAKAGEAYSSYSRWARNYGQRPMTNVTFGRKISERFVRRKKSSGNEYEGFSISDTTYVMLDRMGAP